MSQADRSAYLGLVAVALLLAGGLAFSLRVPETEIELVVKTSVANFIVSSEEGSREFTQSLQSLEFDRITFQDISEFGIFNRRPLELQREGSFPLTLEAALSGNIKLDALEIPPQYRVSLQTTGRYRDFSVALTSCEARFVPKAGGGLQSGGQDTLSPCMNDDALVVLLDLSRAGNFTVPDAEAIFSEVVFENDIYAVRPTAQRGGEALAFDAVLSSYPVKKTVGDVIDPSQRIKPIENLRISNLGFIDVELGAGGVNDSDISGIESGTLYYEALNGRELLLRPGERLRFNGADGVLRVIELEDGLMTVQFRGEVKGMQVGFNDSPRELMPTWIELLLAQNAFAAALGGLGAFITVLVSIRGLWKPKPE